MTKPGRGRFLSSPGGLALAAVLVAASCVQAAFAQTTLRGGVSQTEYTDDYARTCEEQNKGNPYAGMNPFECHGQMAPTDSRGQCSLNIGTVWKKVGNTCYYCAPIHLEGFVLPLDQVRSAESQGWRCGANQTDLCTAICYGGSTYSPPPGVTVVGGGPGLPPTPKSRPRNGGTQGGPPPGYAPQPGPPPRAGAANPCLPFGPGGYDYCANPVERGCRLAASAIRGRFAAEYEPRTTTAGGPSDADAQGHGDTSQPTGRSSGKYRRDGRHQAQQRRGQSRWGYRGRRQDDRQVGQQYKALAAAAKLAAVARRHRI